MKIACKDTFRGRLDHYVEHFEMTNESLLKYSDEVCEAIHSQYRIFEEKHGYRNNNKNSASHAISSSIREASPHQNG